MKKNLFVAIGVTLLLIAIMIGITKPLSGNKVKDVTMGSWDEKTYHNDYFGLEFRLPGNWHHDTKELTAIADSMDSEDEKISYLTGAVGNNRVFMVFAYEMSPLSTILYREGDTRSLRKALNDPRIVGLVQGEMDYEVEADYVNKNGVKFVPTKITMSNGNQQASGKIWFVEKKGYIVMFIFIGVNKSEELMTPIVDSISFE